MQGQSDIEFDSLCQGQLVTVVDGIGGTPHVVAPTVGTRFSATTGFLLATECTADLGPRKGYHVINACVDALTGDTKEILGQQELAIQS